MNLLEFTRLILKNITILIIIPLFCAATTLILTSKKNRVYKSSVLLYTGLASGYSIESEINKRNDHFKIKANFDNMINTILARDTLEEVGLNLFSFHLTMDNYDNSHFSNEDFIKFKKLIETKQISTNLPDTLKIKNNLRDKDSKNDIKLFLFGKSSPYNPEFIRKNLKASRKGVSDMIKITYKSSYPKATKKTLELIVDAFIAKYKDIMETEAHTAYNYFANETEKSLKKLNDIEEKLRIFSEKNNIINYYEQTKYLADQLEKIEIEHQKKINQMEAAKVQMNIYKKELNKKTGLNIGNKSLLKKQETISNLLSKISILEISMNDKKELKTLKSRYSKLSKEIKNDLNIYLKKGTSKGSFPRSKILLLWFESVSSYEKNIAVTNAILKRLFTLNERMSSFAPLGSKLAKYEREIAIAEKEYLNFLSNMNLSKLRQQNLEISAALRVVEKPFFPLKPEKSKRLIIVILSGLTSFTSIIFLIIGLEFFDQTLKSPVRAEKITGLNLIGAFPVLTKKNLLNNLFLRRFSCLKEHIVSNILELENNIKGDTKIIIITSIRKSAGKSIISKELIITLSSLKKRILLISEEKNKTDMPNCTFMEANFKNIPQITAIINDVKKENNFDFVIMKIPSLINFPLGMALIKQVDKLILCIRTDRVWDIADKKMIKKISSLSNVEPEILLNGVKYDHLEEVVDELPKKRSWLRKTVKNAAKLNLKFKDDF